MEDRMSKVAAYILIGGGILAVVLDFFPEAHLEHYLPAVVGVICTGLGFERLGLIDKLVEATRRIESANTRGSYRRLESKAEIYQEASRMVDLCPLNCHIKATDFLPSKAKDSSFRAYVARIAGRMKQSQVQYQLVIGKDESGLGAEGLEIRRAVMAAEAAPLSQFHGRFIDTVCPFEVMIAGDQVLLCFPENPSGQEGAISVGIAIEDQVLARRLDGWYNYYLWQQAAAVGAA
jgi:hypothetical protein